MRNHGNIADVQFIRQGYDIYNLAIKYKLSHNGYQVYVYVNNMTELREEITKFITGEYDEQNQVQV